MLLMKIAFVMKSELAYQRLSNELGKDEAKHLKSLDDVKEAIQYSKPDIVVLDKEVSFLKMLKSSYYDLMFILLNSIRSLHQ